MKILRFSLLIAFIFTSSVLFAQKAGDFVLGGSLSYSNSQSKMFVNTVETIQVESGTNSKSSNFSILPSFHWFVSDNFVLGTSIGYNSSKTFAGYGENGYTTTEKYIKSNAFVFEPSAYYYIKICNKLYYTPQLSIAFSSGKNHLHTYDPYLSNSDEEIGKLSGFGIGLHLAKFEYRATDKIGVGVGLGLGHIAYVHQKVTDSRQHNAVDYKTSLFDSAINTENLLGDITLSFKWYF